MADWPPKRAAAFTVTFPIYDADGDLVTAAASLDSEVSKDSGTFTDVSPGEATEIATSSGIYTLALSATEMTADIVATITKTGTAGAKTAVNVMYTATRQLLDLAYPTTTGRSMDVDASGGVEVGSFQTGAITAGAFTAGAIDAAAIATDAIGAAELADGAITAATFAAGAIDATAIANGAIDAATFAAGAIDAAAIATDAIDSDAIASSVKTELRSLASGTADSGSTTTMVDAVRTEADTDYWKGCWILFNSGTISGQVRLIAAFDPGTDTITFAPATTQAVSTNTYEILPAGGVDVELWKASAPDDLVSGNVPADVQTWLSAAVNALVSGRVDVSVGAMAAAVITAAAIATDAVDADAIAADAANEIADAIFTRASSNWEAAAPVKSLGTAVMKAVHRIRDNAGSLEVYRSNGTTVHASQTVTTDAALNPIDELTGAV
jgi:hypothetical protein